MPRKKIDDEPQPYDPARDEAAGDAEQQSTRDPDGGYDRQVWDADAGYIDEHDGEAG